MVTSNSTACPTLVGRRLGSGRPTGRAVTARRRYLRPDVGASVPYIAPERRGGSMRRPARLVVPAVVLAVAAYVGGDVADVVPGVLTTAAPAAAPAPRPTPADPPRPPAQPALPALSGQAPRPVPGLLRTRLRPLLTARALGPSVSASVLDAASGAALVDVGAATPRVPASTTKLLTGAALLSAVGGGTRVATTAVQGTGADEVVLVGGGDMLLATGASGPRSVVGRAGLGTLARQVAAALPPARRSHVVVTVDDSAFAGGTTAPTWAAADVRLGLTGRVAALGLARDRARPGHPGAADPALSAGRAFAEALARLVAREAGRPPTFEGAAAAVLDEVRRLGVDTGPTRTVDASGLGRGSLIPARTLADVLRLAAGGPPPH